MPITRGRLDPNVDAAIPDEGKEGNRSRGVLRVQLQKGLKERKISLHDRLHSIAHDARFVAEIRSLYADLPVVANLRGGRWLAPSFDDACYFKSTDGHYGHWSLNLRRLNLHVAELASRRNGVIVVDATRRRGKHLPDSFGKTVPVWTCCLNRAVRSNRVAANDITTVDLSLAAVAAISRSTAAAAAAPGRSPGAPEDVWTDNPDATALHVPRERVDAAEKAKILECLDGLTENLLNSTVDLTRTKEVLADKPLRPLWITVRSRIFIDMIPDYADSPFIPIICLGASDPAINDTVLPVFSGDGLARGYTFTYCAGACDDEESWSRDLTPELFWAHAEHILSVSPQSTADVVDAIVQHAQSIPVEIPHDSDAREPLFCSEIGSTGIHVGGRRAGRPPRCWDLFGAVLNVTTEEYSQRGRPPMAEYLQLPVPEGKKDRFLLDALLPQALKFVYVQLRHNRQVLIHCSQGRDRSIGVALAVLAALFDPKTHDFMPSEALDDAVRSRDDWCIRREVLLRVTTKKQLASTLQFLLTYHPRASPSRLTLKKVQRFFLEDGPEATVPAYVLARIRKSSERGELVPEANQIESQHGPQQLGDAIPAPYSIDPHQTPLQSDNRAPDPTPVDRNLRNADAGAIPDPSAGDRRQRKEFIETLHRLWAGLTRAGFGRHLCWHIGYLKPRHAPTEVKEAQPTLTLALQIDKNPEYNCIKLVLLSGTKKRGYVLLEHPNVASSHLRGIQVNSDDRGNGLGQVLIAVWLRLCLITGMTPTTNRIDKVLIARLLQKFGFIARKGGTEVTVAFDENNKVLLYSPSKLDGVFAHRDLSHQSAKIVSTCPADGIIVKVKTTFELGVSLAEVGSRVDRVLLDRFECASEIDEIRRAFLTYEEVTPQPKVLPPSQAAEAHAAELPRAARVNIYD
eukprot:m.281008 g.281008  ORF g.281008 m.281008 type:complete len:913 (-) comp16171_c0_seq3:26-2764(-)